MALTRISGIGAISFLNRTDLPLGLRNNNPGNIRVTSDQWQGMIGSDQGFVTFQDVSYGIRAMVIILKNYINNGYNTITKIISRYAPSSENNTQVYINNVVSWTGWKADETLSGDYNTLFTLIRAMLRQEIGSSAASLVTAQDIAQGINMAGIPGSPEQEQKEFNGIIGVTLVLLGIILYHTK